MKITRLTLLFPLLSLVACGSGGSSGSSSGGGSHGPTVSFLSSASSVTEDTVSVPVTLFLDEAPTADLDVNFTWSGSATEFADYFVPGSTPVTIPKGSQTATIQIQVNEDVFGELDETVQLNLVASLDYNLGAPFQHTLTIIDEDEVQINEIEPNDDHLNPQDIGSIQTTLAYQISGDSFGGDPDVFKFTGVGSCTADVTLDPASGVSQVVINVIDENGQVVDIIDDDLPGTTLHTSFPVADGQVFFLGITTDGVGTAYLLDVVGV